VRIATRLLMSYMAIILLITMGMAVGVRLILNDLADQTAEAVDNSIRTLAKKNIRLSETILADYSKKLVETRADEVAAVLSLKLGHRNISNYDDLRNDQELRAIATRNIYTSDSERRIAGHVDLLDNQGVAVLHPNKEVEGKNYSEWKDPYPAMWQLVQSSFGQEKTQGLYDFINREGKPVRKYMVLKQVAGTPFIVSATVEIDKYFVPFQVGIIRSQQRAQEKAYASIVDSVGAARERARFYGFAGGIGILILAGCFGLWFTKSISLPIKKLQEGVKQIGEGDFDAQVPELGPAEIKQLARSFNDLGHRLTQYVEHLAEETAERQKLESELSIAAEIQRSLLPVGFEPFADREDLEIYAVMQPARNVGGDFYDFFPVDKENLCFAIGDVCGKGVPAAILMAVTKSLLATAAGESLDPGRVLEIVNHRLAQNNENCVFVTVFCGILNLGTGELVYANGGHDSPLLVRQQKEVEVMRPTGGPALGLFDDASYETLRLTLTPGDLLFTYTDGVTEALDQQLCFFSREKLTQEVYLHKDGTARDIIEYVYGSIQSFSQGTPQADDITMMALRIVRTA
jgi:serine phosphatase RsbU (regulator of sigma subunit)